MGRESLGMTTGQKMQDMETTGMEELQDGADVVELGTAAAGPEMTTGMQSGGDAQELGAEQEADPVPNATQDLLQLQSATTKEQQDDLAQTAQWLQEYWAEEASKKE